MYSYSVLNDTNVKAITQNLSNISFNIYINTKFTIITIIFIINNIFNTGTRVIEAGAGTGYIANQLKIAKGNL